MKKTLPSKKNVLGQLRDLNKKFEKAKKEAKKLGISIYKMKKSPAKAAQTGRAIVRRERHMI